MNLSQIQVDLTIKTSLTVKNSVINGVKKMELQTLTMCRKPQETEEVTVIGSPKDLSSLVF